MVNRRLRGPLRAGRHPLAFEQPVRVRVTSRRLVQSADGDSVTLVGVEAGNVSRQCPSRKVSQ
jgi:hypothetical protein